MKIPVAIYPYCSELLPAVKFFERMQDKYSISRLISPPGLRLGGKDAAYAHNHPSIGHVVRDKIDFYESVWSTLFIMRVLQPVVINDIDITKIAEQAILAGKKVVFFDNTIKDIPESLQELSKLHPNDIKIITEDKRSLSKRMGDGDYNLITTPVVLAGGLIAAEDTFEVLLSLADCLKKQGLNISVISKHCHCKMLGKQYHCLNHILDQNNLKEVDKIIFMNSYIREIEQSEMPDVILIEAPDPVMRYTNSIPHGFGILTYMLCQAVKPDYFICCVPCELANGVILAQIREDLSYRLGKSIDAVHVSNVIIDSADILQTRKISYVYADVNMVSEQIKMQSDFSEIPLVNVITDGADTICSTLFYQNNLPEGI